MKVGITELVLSSQPIPEFFKNIKEAGYESAELAIRADKAPLTYSSPDSAFDEAIKISRDLNISIDSITISNSGSSNLVMPLADAKQAMDETIWALEKGAKMGATAALHTLGRFTPELYYEDAYNNALANLKALKPVCEKLKIALAVEFIWSGFLFSPLEMRGLLDAVGSDYVGFYFDSGNMAIYHYPQHWVRALGHHVKRVHVKDWTGGPVNGVWKPLLGGSVNFPAVMAELRKTGYNGPLVSEVDTNLASLKETADSIRKIIAM